MTRFDRCPSVASLASRRSFLRSAGVAAVALPILAESQFAWGSSLAAQLQAAAAAPVSRTKTMAQFRASIPADAVLINANENPMGPCEAARAAIASAAARGGRYDYAEMSKLADVFSQQNTVDGDSIAVYAGSGEPLHYGTLSFVGPDRPLVTANPTYEAAGRAADIAGAKTITIPLTADNAHDVKAMASAAPNAGLIYVCNPNNPTGTITSRKDILWLLENKPKNAVVMVDEAYIQLSDAESVTDQVAGRKDLIVLRTFSKIYGMAGIRAGFAIAHPDTLAKMQMRGENPMPITSSVAARVSLEDRTLVPTRKAYIAGVRTETITFLTANGYKVVPGSQSNCFMIDTGRNGRDVQAAMAAKKVYIGRTWPAWPNVVRITVGTKEEMAKFQKAFKEVMDAPVATAVVKRGVTQHWS